MSRKIDRGKPTPPPWWVELHAAMDSPVVEAGKTGDRAKTTPYYNPKRPAMKLPKQKRPLPEGWAEVNTLSFRRSVRKASSIMGTELSPFLAKG